MTLLHERPKPKVELRQAKKYSYQPIPRGTIQLIEDLLIVAQMSGKFRAELGKRISSSAHTRGIKVQSYNGDFVILNIQPGGNDTRHACKLFVKKGCRAGSVFKQLKESQHLVDTYQAKKKLPQVLPTLINPTSKELGAMPPNDQDTQDADKVASVASPNESPKGRLKGAISDPEVHGNFLSCLYREFRDGVIPRNKGSKAVKADPEGLFSDDSVETIRQVQRYCVKYEFLEPVIEPGRVTKRGDRLSKKGLKLIGKLPKEEQEVPSPSPDISPSPQPLDNMLTLVQKLSSLSSEIKEATTEKAAQKVVLDEKEAEVQRLQTEMEHRKEILREKEAQLNAILEMSGLTADPDALQTMIDTLSAAQSAIKK